jgi:uncharacterized membrane protein
MRDYLHERAEESRHNEVLAYMMFIAGAIFFVGGVLAAVVTNPVPEWFLFFPYQISFEPLGMLGLAFTLLGISLLVFGVGMGLYYSHDRAWYMKELYKSNSMKASWVGERKRKRRNNVKTSPV